MEQEEERDEERSFVAGGIGGQDAARRARQLRNVFIDPFQEAKGSKFVGLHVMESTAALWGRRVHHVTLSESVAFALSDSGEVFAWGGNGHWWHEIQPDSLYQRKWRGETTPRSQLLLGTSSRLLPLDAPDDAEDLGPKVDPDDAKVDVIKTVTKYYNLWEPPPNAQTRMHYLEKELLPKVSFEDLKFSLEMRGKVIAEGTKYRLCEELCGDVYLEKKLLGERAHKAIRELETQVAGLRKRKNMKLANEIQSRIDAMWKPLREVQAEERAAEKAKRIEDAYNTAMKVENDYTSWRSRISASRDNMKPEHTPRGNSLKLNLSGVTPRGPEHVTPRAFEAAIQVSAGFAHACLVHKSGELYTWGQGASGRLGLDLTEGGDPQKDSDVPRLVQALVGKPVVRVSAGYGHSGVIVAGGEVFMWGSGAAGKCGLGAFMDKEECYVSVPTRVLIGQEDRKARKISCGAAHSAVITQSGQLYIWGCGDGGRLGLGHRERKYDSVYVPTLVETMMDQRLSSVTCGNSTTLVVTEIKSEWVGAQDARYRQKG